MNINFRVGYGYDVHAFKIGEHIILGGVKIPYRLGLKAHSDGDVVIHALVDALLGASALGDIGHHFPDTDERWRNKDSRIFLQTTVQMLNEKNWSINNADITIIAEAPKLKDYFAAIRFNLAQDMKIDLNQINVKATTTEKLGFIGRHEGIAATAIALVQTK
ncbi:2-C-methyl-D-erythritol 2,4-cyclodiphosphate synthase [Candidatus Rickettsiella isopodorum]|jgi:2-C-methyl-D-erythritol 2,4-cyclodiphosphate synthase|uniref:2-C-methyl-D-erythritol 2,4-cyclodiphosphate synthase n=1 Tax=Candidatus Rickettsiella isopodorum TaxID=1225476 RepID=A0A1J8NH64_9COXI|nr:2-C-methyl-D-erythritol 2,4-cyclodiphosphate synthase [Candidatus Rickettsiella isopodorum]OIZ94250.1 2-C-methyl-D-erythritol 2,4-cyclodiphosphate synthase [Candidatus Rickettsiella isopodorum]